MYKEYVLYYRQILATPVIGNIDSRYLDENYTKTNVTFKGRNIEEAMKKANKFWIKGQFGMGSFIVILKEDINGKSNINI